MRKILHIITGPPGSGKTTYASKEPTLKHLPVFDTDLNNKNDWMLHHTDCILMTAAPSHRNKQYWLDQAIACGFLPLLNVMWVPRMVAFNRMQARSGQSQTEQNNLNTSVEQWYKLYTRHPEENRIG